MASYQGVKGYKVQSTASDPSNPIIGQVWYNTTSDLLKYRSTVPGGNVFSSGGSMTNVRSSGGGSPAGTDSAALATAGNGATGTITNTEEYDGTTWTAGGNITRGAQRAGFGSFGSQTANAICGGGNPYTNATEEYDGSSWTNVNGMPVSKAYMGSSGTQTAGLISMGYNDPDQSDTQPGSQEYDGTNWSSGGNCNTGSYSHAGFGIQTAAAITGGNNPSTGILSRTEEYDGSTWTTVTAIPAGRADHASGGTQTSGLVTGGSTPTVVSTSLEYDGTNYTAGGNMATARTDHHNSGAGTSSMLVYGGADGAPSVLNSTEEYGVGSPVAATKSVTGT